MNHPENFPDPESRGFQKPQDPEGLVKNRENVLGPERDYGQEEQLLQKEQKTLRVLLETGEQKVSEEDREKGEESRIKFNILMAEIRETAGMIEVIEKMIPEEMERRKKRSNFKKVLHTLTLHSFENYDIGYGTTLHLEREKRKLTILKYLLQQQEKSEKTHQDIIEQEGEEYVVGSVVEGLERRYKNYLAVRETLGGRNGLGDIRNLGLNKPMGYLPIRIIESELYSTIETETQLAKGNGFHVLLHNYDGSGLYSSGELYVYDKDSLEQLLLDNANILEQNNWPVQAEDFVEKVANNTVPRTNKALFNLVAKAFGDYRNMV